MASALLSAAIALLVVALLLLVYILVSQRLVNIQAVWRLAISGHRPSQFYMLAIVLAFAFAVAGTVAAHMERPRVAGQVTPVGYEPAA